MQSFDVEHACGVLGVDEARLSDWTRRGWLCRSGDGRMPWWAIQRMMILRRLSVYLDEDDSQRVIDELPKGLASRLTEIRYFDPSGRRQRINVKAESDRLYSALSGESRALPSPSDILREAQQLRAERQRINVDEHGEVVLDLDFRKQDAGISSRRRRVGPWEK